MSETTIRIYFRDAAGHTEDGKLDMSLKDFGGVVPSLGDTILNPGVPTSLDRQDPTSRDVWTVVERVFNPRDQQDYIALVVTYRGGTLTDTWI
jgi:hypothetical protein